VGFLGYWMAKWTGCG